MTNTEQDSRVEGLPEFTDDQVKSLVEYMTNAGKARARAQGADFSEVDFLVGCMTTLFALGKQNKIPGSWIFKPMAGQSPLDLPDLDQSAYVVYDGRNVDSLTLYKHHSEAAEHAQYLEEHGHPEAVFYKLPVRHKLEPKIERALNEEDS